MDRKQMVSRREFLRWSVVAAGGVAAAACAAPMPAAGDGAMAPAEETVTLDFYDRAERVRPIVEAFNNAQDGIVAEGFYEGGGARYKGLVTRIAAGTAPDLVGLEVSQTGKFADLGAMLDLDPYVSTVDWFPGEIPGALINGFCYYPNQDTGQVVSLPFWPEGSACVWIEVYFEEAGLDPRVPPATWDEIIEFALILAEKTEAKHGFGFGTKMAGGDTWQFGFPFLWTNGASVFNADYTRSVAGSPEAIEAMEFVVGLQHEHNITNEVAAADWSVLIPALLNGEWAMSMGAPSFRFSDGEYTGKIGFWPHPGPEPGMNSSCLGGNTLTIMKQSEKQDAAWSMMNWILGSDEGLVEIWKMGYLPPRTGFLELPEGSEDPVYIEAASAQYEMGRVIPLSPEAPQVMQLFHDALLFMFTQEKTVEEALTDLEEETNKILMRAYPDA